MSPGGTLPALPRIGGDYATRAFALERYGAVLQAAHAERVADGTVCFRCGSRDLPDGQRACDACVRELQDRARAENPTNIMLDDVCRRVARESFRRQVLIEAEVRTDRWRRP